MTTIAKYALVDVDDTAQPESGSRLDIVYGRRDRLVVVSGAPESRWDYQGDL